MSTATQIPIHINQSHDNKKKKVPDTATKVTLSTMSADARKQHYQYFGKHPTMSGQ